MSDDTGSAFDIGRGIASGRSRVAAWAAAILAAVGLGAIVPRVLTGAPAVTVFAGTVLLCIGLFTVAEKHVDW